MMLRLVHFVETVLNPALKLLPAAMDTPPARVAVLGIGYQESKLTARVQVLPGGGRGPAHGLWQCEKGGGVVGAWKHEASRFWLHQVCDARSCEFDPETIWGRIETDDILACALARLLLFTDQHRLPDTSDAAGCWALYMRVWRPGKPRPEDWPDSHRLAVNEVMAT